VVTIGEWTDRIYTHTPPEHIITNVVSGRKMRIQVRKQTNTQTNKPKMLKG
jgi:glucose-6-phosphate 1-epimerase